MDMFFIHELPYVNIYFDHCRAELVNLEELARHMTYICHAPDTSKVEMIRDVLAKMDFDQDGAVKVEHVLRVMELMVDEQVGVSPKLFEEVIEMVAKEEQLETAKLIKHALESAKVNSQEEATTSSPSSSDSSSSVSSSSSSSTLQENAPQSNVQDASSVESESKVVADEIDLKDYQANKDSVIESTDKTEAKQQANRSQWQREKNE